jgi:hypothetical protein
MRILADSDPDPCQTWSAPKVGFCHENLGTHVNIKKIYGINDKTKDTKSHFQRKDEN